MNAEERQAIRAKHQPCHHDAFLAKYCETCEISEWPCDVILVLDELEKWVKE